MPRLYEILGVEKEATHEQIKEGYKEKIKQLKLQKAELEPTEYDKRIKQLNEANEVLSNKGRRKDYDEIVPLTTDFCSFNNEIIELRKFYDDFVKKFVGEMDIPAEKGYSSKLTGINEMQATFKSQAEFDSFLEIAATKFPSGGVVQTDKDGNKQYKTFPEILKEKREKAEKEQKAEEKQEQKSELGSKLLEGVSSTPTPRPAAQ